MDTTLWAKLRDDPRLSWHVVWKTFTEQGSSRLTYRQMRCGRWVGESSLTVDDLPLNEKSCESCARLTLHDQEQAAR